MTLTADFAVAIEIEKMPTAALPFSLVPRGRRL
jgi:hypothetical protein